MIQKVLAQIEEVHFSDYSWDISEPVITQDNVSKTVTVKARLI